MSQENVEVVRGYVAGYGRDPAALVREAWDRRGDFYPVEKFPESRPCHGVEEIAAFLTEFQQAWAHFEFVINAITPVADDRVLVHASLRAEGHGSGLRLEGDVFHCFWLRNGRILREEDHLTLPGARRALGLGDS